MRWMRNSLFLLAALLSLGTPVLLLLYWLLASKGFQIELHFSTWQPKVEQLFLAAADYNLPQLILGFLCIALLAFFLAIPIAMVAALFVGEFAPFRVKNWLYAFMRINSAVPLAVIGLGFFGLFLPLLPTNLHFIQIILLSAILSALMLLPALTARFLRAFNQVPDNLVSTAYVVGATPWQVSRLVLLPHARFDLGVALLVSTSRLSAELLLLVVIADFGLSMAPAIWVLALIIAALHGLAIWLRQLSRNQHLQPGRF